MFEIYPPKNNVPLCTLELGHQGENEARCVVFDIAPYIAEFGKGTFTVVNRRHGEEMPYLVEKTDEVIDEDSGTAKALWILTDTDTAIKGDGRAELRYYVEGMLVKTDVFKTNILPGLGIASEDVPDPYDDVLEKIEEYASTAGSAAAEANQYAASASSSAAHAEGAANAASGFSIDARNAAEEAAQSASNAEAWAVGQRDGADVESGDDTFLNNSKYYAALAEAAAERAEKATDTKIFGAKWDRLTNKLTRVYDADGITTDTTNFCHKGALNANYDNPFDKIYPWSEMVVCDVDLEKYRAGADLKDCIISVYGDPDFTYTGSDKVFVGRYRPEFWYRSSEDQNGNITFMVSQIERVGFEHAEEAIDGIADAVDDGSGNDTVTSGADVPLTNIAVSAIHARVKASGFTLQNIKTLDQIIILYLVEYANMNAQNALGDGCSSCYRQNAADVVANVQTTDGVTSFEVPYVSALFTLLDPGAQLSFGASSGATTYKANVKEATNDGTTITVTLDREIAIEDGMILSVHGFSACEFPLIGNTIGNASGYLGTSGHANAWYRGAKIFGNRYSYILGIYRQTGGKIWICPDGVNPDNYDALNTSVHKDTGATLPNVSTAAWTTVGGNAQRISGVQAFLLTGTTSGNSNSPIGDQQYVPTASDASRILLWSCYAAGGWHCGPFGGYWNSTASYSHWLCAGWPVLLKKSL